MRLDVKLHELHPEISRAQLQRFIKKGKVSLNGDVETRAKHLVYESDKIKLDKTVLTPKAPKNIQIPVLFEDEACIVIDKPAGVLTHSKGAFNPEPTVASWLKPKTEGFADDDRSGIVHRLDRATSGAMIVAKNPDALSFFQKQFSTRKVKKTYIAIVEGDLQPKEAIIDVPLERNPREPQRFRANHAGKHAVTHYKVQKTFTRNGQTLSLVELKPKTGRTHQLRVHLGHIKHPIIGDTFYKGKVSDRLYLHSAELEITLINGDRRIFKSELPPEFKSPKINKI